MICLIEVLITFVSGWIIGRAGAKIKISKYISDYSKRDFVTAETLREMQIINKL